MANKLNNKKNEQILKRIITFLVVILVILVFISKTLNDFIDRRIGNVDIQTLIGREYSGGNSLTIRENLILRGAIDAYIKSIYTGNYEQAYAYLLPRYREFVSKEIYISKIEEIGKENFMIQSLEISQETEKMFLFDITIKNEQKLQTLLILDKEKYYIVPEPFLEYNQINESITKKGVTYTLKGYQVDIERCIFDMTIENENDEPVELIEAKMINEYGVTYKSSNSTQTIQPNEIKEISFIIETHLDFPSTFEITRNDNEKIRVYTFEF